MKNYLINTYKDFNLTFMKVKFGFNASLTIISKIINTN
jgi:hypothetical protein